MPDKQTTWWLVIASLLLLAFCLGLPQFHYTVALMIAAILRHKDEPAGAVLGWAEKYRDERSFYSGLRKD